VGHRWQAITEGIFWCDNCGALKNVAGEQTAFCPVRGNWSYTDPPCPLPAFVPAVEEALEPPEEPDEVVLY